MKVAPFLLCDLLSIELRLLLSQITLRYFGISFLPYQHMKLDHYLFHALRTSLILRRFLSPGRLVATAGWRKGTGASASR
jgi:hypothetical protein